MHSKCSIICIHSQNQKLALIVLIFNKNVFFNRNIYKRNFWLILNPCIQKILIISSIKNCLTNFFTTSAAFLIITIFNSVMDFIILLLAVFGEIERCRLEKFYSFFLFKLKPRHFTWISIFYISKQNNFNNCWLCENVLFCVLEWFKDHNDIWFVLKYNIFFY